MGNMATTSRSAMREPRYPSPMNPKRLREVLQGIALLFGTSDAAGGADEEVRQLKGKVPLSIDLDRLRDDE